MSKSKWDSDTMLFLIVFSFIVVVCVVNLIYAGWLDFEQNKTINECIRAGHTWKDGNCG